MSQQEIKKMNFEIYDSCHDSRVEDLLAMLQQCEENCQGRAILKSFA